MTLALSSFSSSLCLSFLAACSQATARAGDGPPIGQPGTFPLEDIQSMVKETVLHESFVPDAPLGLGLEPGFAATIPADNPLTRAKVELGSHLYFDPRLSRGASVACASCHHPSSGWVGGGAPPGLAWKGRRNAPTIVNRILGTAQFWDGRAKSLEEQALDHLGDPKVMGGAPQEIAARLNGIEGYRIQFEAVFGGPATAERIAMALSAFERTIMSGNSKYDIRQHALPFLQSEPKEGEYLVPRKEALDAEAAHKMSAAALRGSDLFFGKARCGTCHSGSGLTDERFHNLGVGMGAREPDLGRFAVTQIEKDKGAFKTPTLRNVAKTAPYMHDGSLATLRDVVDFLDKGGQKNPWLASEMAPLGLSEQEKQDPSPSSRTA
jgi:cytochrome c peroxidase